MHAHITCSVSTLNSTEARTPLTTRPSFRASDQVSRPASEDSHSQETIIESSSEGDLYNASPHNDSYSTILSENSAVSEEFVKIDMEMDPKLWEARNERRYRMSLTHRYHHSCRYFSAHGSFYRVHKCISVSLALWDPVPVAVGAIGYVVRPSGTFITLFNAINPTETDDPRVQSMPSIAGYGKTPIGNHRHATRNAALRGLDAVVGFLSSGKRDDLSSK